MSSIRRGPIPSDLGWLVDFLDDTEERLRTLEGPDGGQAAGVLAYLAGLRTYGVNAFNFNTGTVPNDGVTRWFDLDASVTLQIPTRKFLVTASVGEASVTPGGSVVQAWISYEILDANGDNIASTGALGHNSGRLYTSSRIGLSISTGPQKHEVFDVDNNPGPYTVKLYAGFWSPNTNTTAASCQFNDPSLIVQVIGEGAGA